MLRILVCMPVCRKFYLDIFFLCFFFYCAKYTREIGVDGKQKKQTTTTTTNLCIYEFCVAHIVPNCRVRASRQSTTQDRT